MLRMDEINKIRKSFFIEGENKNSLARRFNRSWSTINTIVTMEREDLEKRGKRPNRKGKVVTPEVLEKIKSYFEEEQTKLIKRKQRYTGTKIFTDLKSQGIYKGSKRRLQEVVSKLRKKEGQSKKPSFLPLKFPLGSALQVDHGEVEIEIGRLRQKVYLFVGSVPGYVLRYSQAFPVKSQEAWGEFHERVLRFFGGVFKRIIYDNDSVLVKKVLGRERRRTTFSLSLEEHFGFESHFCNIAAGNEKGAVENAVGYCRRNFLAGVPSFSNWEELNRYLLKCSDQDIDQGKHYKTNRPLKLIFKDLKEKLNPLPFRKEWCKKLDCKVDSCQLVSIGHHEYSVPERYVGSSVNVDLGIFQLKIFQDNELIAKHKRQYGNEDSLILDHYLDQLQRKPSAFWYCKAVKDFDPRYLEVWRCLSERFPTNEATRQFVKVLILGRRYSQDQLLKAIETALKYKAINYAAIKNIVYQLNEPLLVVDEEALKKTLKSVDIQTWSFDLSPYAELSKEVAR